ncbi:MAG TPA: tRNA (cytidine(34)-2'-O)-methyltransferase [Pseudobdellovibrionaceae bacterium]|nr:tRNA (cytidine(34)-2'-O)-methyltransferase [Pseudobdellovibrionaceae bacterium]
MSNFRVVLIEPEIPQNTGNIGRTCVATNSELHLVGPLGFEIDHKQLKRAGLDYWPHLKWFQYPNVESWLAKVDNPDRVFYFTTKSKLNYFQFQYQPGDWFVFGKETKGLPPEMLRCNSNHSVTIPQLGPVRSLNLATSVAIALYEGVRQIQTEHLPNE